MTVEASIVAEIVNGSYLIAMKSRCKAASLTRQRDVGVLRSPNRLETALLERTMSIWRIGVRCPDEIKNSGRADGWLKILFGDRMRAHWR